MPVTSFIPAIIGAGASLIGNNASNNAIKDASGAQLQATREQIEFAREQRDYAMGILRPFIESGGQAQAYMDALLYGEGSYGGSSGAGATPDYGAYLERYKDVGAEWQKLVQSGQAAQFNNDPAKYAEWHYNTYGKTEGREVPTSGGTDGEEATTITRDQVMELIEQSPLYQYANDDFRNRVEEANRLYREERNINRNELDKGRDINRSERDKLLTITAEDFQNRRGYTNDAIKDRARLLKRQQEDNVDRMAATIGVTGQLGKAQRAADERANYYAEDFAGTVRDWRGEDLGYKTGGQRDAWGGYYGNERDAYGNFYGNERNATLRRGGTRASAYDQFAGGRVGAYSDFASGLDSRANQGYDAATRAVGAGADYANAASNATRAGANAYAQGQYALGQNRSDFYSDIGSSIADAWGAISNRQKKPPSSSGGGEYWNSYGPFG